MLAYSYCYCVPINPHCLPEKIDWTRWFQVVDFCTKIKFGEPACRERVLGVGADLA
jgi:hypothetical protein